MQFLYEGATKFNEPGVFLSFEENEESLYKHALQFGWDFKKLEQEGKCVLLAFEPFKFRDIQKEVVHLIKKMGIKRVVIDSLSVFAMSFKENQYKLRKELYSLSSFLKTLNCTTIVTAETEGEPALDITSGGGALTREGFIEYVADSVMTMHNSGIGGEADRAIRVVKMRRTNHRRDPIPMKIGRTGMKVLS